MVQLKICHFVFGTFQILTLEILLFNDANLLLRVRKCALFGRLIRLEKERGHLTNCFLAMLEVVDWLLANGDWRQIATRATSDNAKNLAFAQKL